MGEQVVEVNFFLKDLANDGAGVKLDVCDVMLNCRNYFKELEIFL